MPVALEQFVKQIADSGVIAPGKLEHFVPPKAHPKDAQELARQLVQSKQLTKYQAQEIYAGRAKSLLLGNYTILDKIGAGGMGQVFKAEHRRMHRVVAIKVLPKAVIKDAMAVARFQREVEAAAKLEHPNIVTAHDADEAGGIHFLVMQYVEGSDLSALVKKHGPLPIAKAVAYVLQAARGLDYAHKRGIIHRDIKPANLLLNSEGTVKILDMGLARIEGDEATATQAELTGTGAVLGTVDYMAPEQALSTHHADARADIYSLGCTLHYLITGHAAYDGDTLMAKLLAHRDKPIPSLGSEAPPELQTVFEKMVAKKIEDRYQTMNEVIAALEPFVAGAQTSASVQQTLGTGSSSDALKFLNDVSLHTIAKPKPATKAGPVASALRLTKGKKKKRFALAAVGAALAGLTILAAVIFKMRTSDGTLVVTLNQPDATVQVLSEAGKIEITRPGEKGTLSIAVDPGKHWLRVEKDGFRFFVKDFTVEKGGTTEIAATLEPAIARANKDTSGATDRRVALWWLSQHRDLRSRGLLYLRVNGKEMGIWNIARDLPKGLPNEPFQILRLETNRATDRDLADLVRLPALAELSLVGSHVTAEGVAALKKALPNCYVKWGVASNPALATEASPAWDSPAFRQWAGQVAVMPAEKQVEEVAKKLLQLNPDFDGKVIGGKGGSPEIENGVVTGFGLSTDHVADISPVRALSGLKVLFCAGRQRGAHSGKFADLSPLRGMHLTELVFANTQGSDISPLQGMPLTFLNCADSRVADISPLSGMRLTQLAINGTSVADLSPVKGMQLNRLSCYDTQISDLSALQGVHLIEVGITPKNITKGLDVIRQMKSLATIGVGFGDEKNFKPAEFWKKYDAGEFGKPQLASTPAKQPLAFETPGFDQWMKGVAAMSAEKEVEAVAKKLQELNPGFDGKVTPTIQGGVVTAIQFGTDSLTDISPVRAFAGLKGLSCQGSLPGKGILSSLLPLKGMRLAGLDCGRTKVTDLSPLEGMPLTDLRCRETPVSDLSPLKGMPLKLLGCEGTRVTNLSPLGGMPLTRLSLEDTPVADLSPLNGISLRSISLTPKNITRGIEAIREMKSLETIGPHWNQQFPSAEFWKKYDAGEFGKPGLASARAKQALAFETPGFDQWARGVAAMPAEQQVAEVAKKLQELNPAFSGLVAPTMENGKVTKLAFDTDKVADLSPVRALAGLKSLRCTCSIWDRSKRLHTLSNLCPLKGMGLTKLDIRCTNVSDLSPLAGMKLTELGCQATSVSDLSPLKGMPLETLWCHDTIVSDLSPLQGMPLRTLLCSDTKVSDLSPLKGMPLARLGCFFTPVSDLSPLQGMRLAEIAISPKNITKGMDAIRQMPSVKTIATDTSNKWPAHQFWTKYDAGEFGKPAPAPIKNSSAAFGDPAFQQWMKTVVAMPAEQQVAEVVKKLQERNPDFDGKAKDWRGSGYQAIENGVVIRFAFFTDSVSDISPVRAFPGLQWLWCMGSGGGKGKLTDLSPLRGMKLTSLGCYDNQALADLSPVQGMRLTNLQCYSTRISDLTPLVGMPLEQFNCIGTPVQNLVPLLAAPLVELHCGVSRVSDSSPLANSQTLTKLDIRRFPITGEQVQIIETLTHLKSLDLGDMKISAADVAALRRALPHCKIDWDGPAAAK